jgi:hypothetical protein
MTHQSKLKLVPRDKIVFGRNPRLPQRMAAAEMAADLGLNGMETPPTVFATKDGQFEMLKGHRRITGADYLQETNPKAYQKWFAKGFLVEIVSGISYEQAQFMKIDHGNELPLGGYELQECCNLLFDYDKTEKEVVVRLAGMLDRISPMKATARKELESKRANLAALEAKGGNKKAIITLAKEIEDFQFNYRRGKIQNAHHAYRCPNIVMHALYFKETGDHPEGVSEKIFLPHRITMNDIKMLWKAFEVDLEETDDKGLPKYSKITPGPAFTAKWDEVCEATRTRDAESEAGQTRARAKSHKELEVESKSKWMSTGFKLLTLYHANEDVEIKFLKEADQMLYHIELVSERSPKEYGEMVKLAKSLEELAIAENAEKIAASK